MIISQKFCLNFFFNARKRKRIILYINRNENSKNLKKKRWGWNLCDFTKQTSDQVWRNHSKWPNEYVIIRSYSCSKCQTTKTVTLHSWSLVSQEPFHQRESQFFTITTFFWMKRASVNDRWGLCRLWKATTVPVFGWRDWNCELRHKVPSPRRQPRPTQPYWLELKWWERWRVPIGFLVLAIGLTQLPVDHAKIKGLCLAVHWKSKAISHSTRFKKKKRFRTTVHAVRMWFLHDPLH